MRRHDDVVIRRQHEVFQIADAAPAARFHDERALRIRLADGGDGLRVNRIHQLRGRLVMRLVVQLKHQRRRKIFIVRRDLSPDFEELIRRGQRVLIQRVEMVEVNHHCQFIIQRVGHDKIHFGKNCRRQREVRRGARVAMPRNWHAHMIEPLVLDRRKLAGRHRQRPTTGLQIISQVHPPLKFFRRGVGGRVAVRDDLHRRRIGRNEHIFRVI
jgi:hypothetical protein